MVQVVPADPGWGGFGESLGKGLVEGYQNRSDQKAIQKAVVDLGENPTPQDVLKAVTGTKTHNPEAAANFFKNFLSTAELENNTSKTALQVEKDKNSLLQGNKVAAELGYTPEETAGLNYDQVIKYDRAKKGQNPKVAISERPITPEQQKALTEARAVEGYEDMDEAQAYQTLVNAGVSRTNADTEAKLIGERNKRKHELNQTHHKDSSKYDEEVREEYKTAKENFMAIDDIEEAINSGNVKPLKFGSLLRGFGKIGDKLADLFTNSDQAKFSASIPNLLKGAKELFGVRLSDADLRVVQDKLPGLGKDPEANKAILGVLRKYAQLKEDRYNIGLKLKKDNKGLRPLGYEDKVEEELIHKRDADRGDDLIPVRSPSGVIKMVPRKVVEASQGGK